MRRTSPAPPPPDRIEALLRPGPGGAAPRQGLSAAPDEPAAAPPERTMSSPGLAEGARHRAPAPPPPPRLSLPGPLRGARIRPAWGALAGLALVGLAVAAIMGVRVLAAGASAAPTAVGPTSAGAGVTGAKEDTGGAGRGASHGSAGSGGAPGASAPPGKTPGQVVVHVVGAVARPGVYRLAEGSRLEDAVRAAGGAADAAELGAVNLARPCGDGEQIVVPVKGAAPVGAPPAAAGAMPGAASVPAAKVDLNRADAAALDALPGVGPVTAGKIIEWRTAHGRFSRVEELAEVPGIGAKLVEQLRPLVRV